MNEPIGEVQEKKPPRPDVPRYHRISCRFWEDEKVLTWPDPMKLLFIHLLTTKHRTLEGFFVVSPAYIAADIRWPLKRVKDLLTKLQEAGVITFDHQTNLLLIRNALRFQQPESLNVVKGVISRVRNLPANSAMLQEFLTLAKVHCSRSGLSIHAQGLPSLLEKEFGKQLINSPQSVEQLSPQQFNDCSTAVRRVLGGRYNS